MLQGSVFDYRGITQQHGQYIVVKKPSLNLKPDVSRATSETICFGDSMVEINTFSQSDSLDLRRIRVNIELCSLLRHISSPCIEIPNKKGKAHKLNKTMYILIATLDAQLI